MNTTHGTSPVRQRPFLAGFWLIAVIPVYIPILIMMTEIFDLDFESLPARFTFFLIHLVGGYLWARSLGRRSGFADNQRMNMSGALAFSVMVIWLFILPPGSALQKQVDHYIATFAGTGNLEFGVLFAPWTGLVAGISGLAIGLSLRNWKLGFKLFGMGFVSGFLIYLVIMFTMQLLGFEVGSGRPVMLPTTFLSMWITALVGSALFGKVLSKSNDNQYE